jgi:hypothetical protein
MTTAETNAIDKAATVAAQGAHVAREKVPAKKAASPKKSGQGQENPSAKAKAAAPRARVRRSWK